VKCHQDFSFNVDTSLKDDHADCQFKITVEKLLINNIMRKHYFIFIVSELGRKPSKVVTKGFACLTTEAAYLQFKIENAFVCRIAKQNISRIL
jgi:hypothetical protein